MPVQQSESSTLVQRALRHDPGRFHALFTFEPQSPELGLTCAATLLRELESEELARKPLKVLVALAHSLFDGAERFEELRAEFTEIRDFPKTQPRILVQVAAETEDERSYARRLVRRIFSGSATLEQEFYGGRHLMSREPFGFPETSKAGAELEVPVSARIPGVSWLLYQQCIYDLPSFFSLDRTDQERVVGRERSATGHDLDAADSHLAHARKVDLHDGRARLLRRSFSYAGYHEEGLLFVASAAHPQHLKDALGAFEADRLRKFVRLGAGGLYVVPPNADWLGVAAPASLSGAARPLVEDIYYPRHPLYLYELTPSSHQFFKQVFHANKDNFDENGKLREDLKLLVKGFAKLLYGGRISTGSPLFRVLEKLFVPDTSELAAEDHAPDHKLDRVRESVFNKRQSFERGKHAKRDAAAAANNLVAALEAEFQRSTASERSVIRTELCGANGVLNVLKDKELAKLRVADLVPEVICEDAETLAGMSAERKQELATIVETCEEAAAEARSLNDMTGTYLTITC